MWLSEYLPLSSGSKISKARIPCFCDEGLIFSSIEARRCIESLTTHCLFLTRPFNLRGKYFDQVGGGEYEIPNHPLWWRFLAYSVVWHSIIARPRPRPSPDGKSHVPNLRLNPLPLASGLIDHSVSYHKVASSSVSESSAVSS